MIHKNLILIQLLRVIIELNQLKQSTLLYRVEIVIIIIIILIQVRVKIVVLEFKNI